MQSEDSVIKEEEETTRTNIHQGSYKTQSLQLGNNFAVRREFLDKEIYKLLKYGSSEDISMARDFFKGKYIKYQNKNLIKELYYRSKLSDLNNALRNHSLNESRRDF